MKRALLVLVLGLAGCLDSGLMIGDSGDPDGAPRDSGRDADAAADAMGDRDSGMDSGGTDGGPSTTDCAAPWLYYVSTLSGAARVVRFTIEPTRLVPCPLLTGGGALDASASSVAVVGDALVVVGSRQLQGLDVASDAIAWTIEDVASGSATSRSAIAPVDVGFVVAWSGDAAGDALVAPTYFDAMHRASQFQIDSFHYDLAAAPHRPETVWSARDPGIVALYDRGGSRTARVGGEEGRVGDARRLFAVQSGRMVVTQSSSRTYYEVSTSESIATSQTFEYDAGCEEFHLAVPHPSDPESVFLGCRRNSDSRTTIRSISLFQPLSSTTGTLSSVFVPEAGEEIRDLSVYEP